MSPAANFNGQLYVANIGSDRLLEDVDSKIFEMVPDSIRGLLCQTDVKQDSYKKTRGSALIVAGSKNYSGAAVLCGNACFTSGVGIASVVTPESVQGTVAKKLLNEILVFGLAETLEGAFSDAATEEVIALSERSTITAVGPGLSSSEKTTKEFVRKLVEKSQETYCDRCRRFECSVTT